jgi:peptide/nickel transport system substrate-binding protein
MIEDAGVAGEKVTVWGNNDDPTDKVTEAYAEQLSEMGFDAEPEIIDGGVYFQTIGNAKTAPQTGFLNWFQDFPHPFNFFFLVDGDTIQPTNNQNPGNVDDPKINDEINRLLLEPDLATVEQDWADLNRYLVESAAIAPYGHRSLSTFVSDRIDFEETYFHPVYNNDYTSFQLTEGSE